MHRRTTLLAALPQPRHGTSAAAGVVASHRALNGAILPIEGARTHAPAISTGALAVLRAFQHAQPGPRRVPIVHLVGRLQVTDIFPFSDNN